MRSQAQTPAVCVGEVHWCNHLTGLSAPSGEGCLESAQTSAHTCNGQYYILQTVLTYSCVMMSARFALFTPVQCEAQGTETFLRLISNLIVWQNIIKCCIFQAPIQKIIYNIWIFLEE